MSLLSGGLTVIPLGSTAWRPNLNTNISSIYTFIETNTLLDNKASIIHEHIEYWPLALLLTSADILPVVSTLLSDITFDNTHSQLLLDRVTNELYRLTVTSGVVGVTATGTYFGSSPDSINNSGGTINTVSYPTVINGDII